MILWDVNSGEPIMKFKGHKADILKTIFSPKNNLIASCSKDKIVYLWDLKSYRNCYELKGHRDSVKCIDFSPNGLQLASASNKTLILWDMSDNFRGNQIIKNQFDEADIINLKYASESPILYLISFDRSLHVFNTKDLEPIEEPKSVFQSQKIDKIKLASNENNLVCSTDDNQIIIRDLLNYDVVAMSEKQTTDNISALSISKNNNLIAAGSQDNVIMLYEIVSNNVKLIKGPLKHHSKAITVLCFSNDNKLLASGSKDNTLAIWNLTLDKPLFEGLKHHTDAVKVICFSKDGDKLISAGKDGRVIIWNARTGERDHIFELKNSIQHFSLSYMNGNLLCGDIKGK